MKTADICENYNNDDNHKKSYSLYKFIDDERKE